MTPAQLAELAEIPSVAGAKISGEPTARVLEYVRAVPDGFVVYSGNDIEFGDFVRAGGTGGVSGVSSVFPRPFVALADALRRGDEQAAAAAQDRVKRAVEAVAGADIALIKAGLQRGKSGSGIGLAASLFYRNSLGFVANASTDSLWLAGP